MESAIDQRARYRRVLRSVNVHVPDAVYRAVAEDYVARFSRLLREWRQSTLALSVISQKTAHPAFQQIVAMGEIVVPLILSELRRHPDFLFLALQEITGENPVPADQMGNPRAMIDSWLEWGEGRADHVD